MLSTTNAIVTINRFLPPSAATAVLRLADPELVHALETPDQTLFDRLQADWAEMLAVHQEFSDGLESVDPYVCDVETLADLIAHAPTSPIRHALREIAYCREQLALMLGLNEGTIGEKAQLVLGGANAEWDILLLAHPFFEACFSNLDRFTCSRAALVDAMLLAPTEVIRHVLRETYCFREVASLMTKVEFT